MIIGFVIYPNNSILLGVIFGVIISILYTFMMANRVKKAVYVPFEHMVSYMKVGSMMRFTLIIVFLYFVFRSSKINLYGAGIGVIIGPIMISIIGFIDAFARTRKGE